MAALQTQLSQIAADRDRLAAQCERWFNAAVVWAADRLLNTPRLTASPVVSSPNAAAPRRHHRPLDELAKSQGLAKDPGGPCTGYRRLGARGTILC